MKNNFKHKDCKYFKNGKCRLIMREVPSNSSACKNFKKARKGRVKVLIKKLFN